MLTCYSCGDVLTRPRTIYKLHGRIYCPECITEQRYNSQAVEMGIIQACNFFNFEVAR